MFPSPISIRRSFATSILIHFPQKSTHYFTKLLSRNVGVSNSVRYSGSSAIVCQALSDFSVEENGESLVGISCSSSSSSSSYSSSGGGRREGIDYLRVMEERGIRANYQTFLLLLKGCINNSRSFVDGTKLHGKILKCGFDEEHDLCLRLIDFYIGGGDLVSAMKVYDDMRYRSLASWNKAITVFLARQMTGQVLNIFSRMVGENVHPDENTFAGVLRASGGGKVSFNFVKQVHAKSICYGFGCNPLVCNPLIDLYAKNGFVHAAKLVFDQLVFKDNVSWVAMISGFSQNGREQDAILLFCEMHTSGVLPTPYVVSSCLSACTKIKLFKVGEQLHALIPKWGFTSEIFVCNALITLYSRLGNLLSAELIFSYMQHRDRVSYNSLMSGLIQRGFHDRALRLFEKVQLDFYKPDCVTVASLLSACAAVGAYLKGKQLHSYAIKAGMSSDIIIEGSLLDLYVKCADIDTAHEYFLTTETENVVLWNVMLVAYGKLGNLDESFKIFTQMQFEGLVPNEYTYPGILRTCTKVGAFELGEQIHSHTIKTGFQHNVYVCSVLIDMYGKHGKLEIAREILSRLPEEDVVAWTAMIAGYAQHDMCSEALLLFEEMQYLGIRSDDIGFSGAISACAGIQALKLGRQIHSQSVISGYTKDLAIGNTLVSLYARCGKLQDAYLAFEKIDSKDNISWNGLLSGFAQSGYWEEALQVFAEMNRTGVEIDLVACSSAVSAAANIPNIKQGKQIHVMMIKTGNELEAEACNVLITLYAKCGIIDDAKRKFIGTSEKNVVTWNAMITGYSQHGFGTEALRFYEEMKRLGVIPNHVTYLGVLAACSHVGLVDEGLRYFKSMSEEAGLVPKLEHYACVVDLLGRAGLLSRAIEFIGEMPVTPDAMVWRTLLSACRVHKNMEIGELAARHLLELEPEDSAPYVLLSNIYAVSGKWNKRDHTRQMMKKRGVKKEPGASWIEVMNSSHTFFVGDQRHPLADKIFAFLNDLNMRAAQVGYVQERNSLWSDVEQLQKDPTVYTHSEKLAVSFGLLSLSTNMPIHVFKNLRVCNDCHNWLKFVSKISNRTIVVRDKYRFHHFEGGDCSCKDYW